MEEEQEGIEVEILYEDNHLIAVNKPSGVLVQGDKSEDKSLLDYMKDWIKEEYNKPGAVYLGLIHRVDRPVSGVVLFAKTSKALTRMNDQFKNREVQKTYWALSRKGLPNEQGKLEHWLVKDNEKNKSKAIRKEVHNSKKAILNYELISRMGEKFLFEIDLGTGRHHQIRVQLSKEGSPIIGDFKYGAKRGLKDKSICLHSRYLKFMHPVTKEEISITAPLPKSEFWQDFRNV